MIMRYGEIWKDHPFQFRIPYQQEMDAGPLSGVSHEFVRTPLDIKQCVLALLEGIDDDQWIYWCIDDKYPMLFDVEVFARCYNCVLGLNDLSIAGISLCRPASLMRPSSLDYTDVIDAPWGEKLIGRSRYKQIWLHQFVRAKVIRKLFEGFPDAPFSPKEMDGFHRQVRLPGDHRLFVARYNHAVFGESTTRGGVTPNCLASLARHGLVPPGDMTVVEKPKIIGQPRHSFRAGLYRVGEYFRLKGGGTR
jgi:hypothetical protein